MEGKVKTRIRKNDVVQVIAGKGVGKRAADAGSERGKRGKVVSVDRAANRAVVQGVRVVYRHLKQSRDPNRPGGGRVEKDGAVHLSNLMLVCPKCDAATRIGVRMEAQERAGQTKTKRIRVCKKCGVDIPERE